MKKGNRYAGALLAAALVLAFFLPAQAERRTMKAGVADRTVYFVVYDSSSSTGARLTTLAFDTASLDCEYTRSGVAQTSGGITLATQTAGGAHTDGGFVHVGKGAYRLDLPDAATAAGVAYVRVDCDGAANMVPATVEIELVAYDPQSGTNLGLSSLPTANAGANTGLPVVGSQIPNANASAAGGLPTRADVNTEVDTALADYDAPTFAELDTRTDAIQADTDDIQTRLPAALSGGKMDSVIGAIATVTAGTGNTSTFAIPIDETNVITADGRYVGNFLICGGERREIVATDDNTTDLIVIGPGLPFTTAPDGVSCTIEK